MRSSGARWTRRTIAWSTRLSVASAATFVLGACERVVSLDLKEGPTRLVVEARLERVLGRVSGTQTITLTTTAPYFSNALVPRARGAQVRVTDYAGRVVTFVESGPGTYTTENLEVRAGLRYRLAITYEGQRYEAVETAQSVATIDSLYFEKPSPGRFAGTEGVRATIDLVDPAGVRNFYLWEQYVGGKRQLGPDSTFKLRVAAPDDAFDGLEVTGFQPYEGVDIPLQTEVLVRQIGLSEAIYRYYFALSDQVAADGSPFAVPPASVRGNVANVTDPSRFALGYFSVGEVAEARTVRVR